jgi:hypothetical protein
MGSTEAARRAGRNAAISATATMMAAAAAKMADRSARRR